MNAEDFETYVYVIIAALVLCSFITRSGFFLLGEHIPLSDGVRQALRYAPAAVLTAIIVPGILPLASDGTMTIAVDQLLAAAVGVLVCLRTKNAILVIVAGMLVFWSLRWFFAGFSA